MTEKISAHVTDAHNFTSTTKSLSLADTHTHTQERANLEIYRLLSQPAEV